ELLGRAVGRQETVWTATLLRLAVSVFAICSRMPSTSPLKSGRPPLFREAFSKVRLSILCRHSGDRIPPERGRVEHRGLRLGCWAGRRAGPLAAALDIFSLCQLYYHRRPNPATRHCAPVPGSGPPAQADSQRQGTSGAQSVAGRVQGFDVRCQEDVLVRIGIARTTTAPSRGLCGPPTVGAKDSL